MVQIDFVAADGKRIIVGAKAGFSLMEVAVQNDIAGIIAECGGACACATCHVQLDQRTFEQLPAPQGYEAELLEALQNAGRYSRLSCQIEISDILDGAQVTVIEPN